MTYDIKSSLKRATHLFGTDISYDDLISLKIEPLPKECCCQRRKIGKLAEETLIEICLHDSQMTSGKPKKEIENSVKKILLKNKRFNLCVL